MDGRQAFKAFFGIVGVVLIISGVLYTFGQSSMLGRSVKVQATVVDVQVETSVEKGKTVTSRYAVYEFYDPFGSGEVVRRQSRGGGNDPQIGQRATVIYDPEDLYYVTEDTFFGTWGGTVVFLFVGAAFLVVSGLPWYVWGAIKSRC